MECSSRGLALGVLLATAETCGALMAEGFEVPSMGMRELTAAKASHVYYPDRALVDPPLTGVECHAFAQEIGNRRQRWRDACDAHLWDLYRAHPNGIAVKSRRSKAALWVRK